MRSSRDTISYMSLHVNAIYEHGMLKPLQPLDLAENEVVAITITQPDNCACQPDWRYVNDLRDALKNVEPALGLDEVRRRLGKIPGTLTADFIAEREDR